MTANPISCPTCFQHWDFKTDHLGRLLAVHPIGKCVPREPIRYEASHECSVCGDEIYYEKAFVAQKRVFLCSKKCELERKARRRVVLLAGWRKYSKKKAEENRLRRQQVRVVDVASQRSA